LLIDERSRWAVETVERYEDDEADDEDLRLALIGAENAAELIYTHASTATQQAEASAAFAPLGVAASSERAADVSFSQAASAAYHAATADAAPSASRARNAERIRQTHLLRDIFGNPFRRNAVDSACLRWNDAVVVRLAQSAYDERTLPTGILDKTRLAVLADALEEAGCTDEQILSHLRKNGEHYRGCFVVDALLGKG
jgi:hypothetical protein